MKIFERAEYDDLGAYLPSALTSIVTLKEGGTVYTLRIPTLFWYAWEQRNCGYSRAYGLKWFNYHRVVRPNDKTRSTWYFLVNSPLKTERVI